MVKPRRTDVEYRNIRLKIKTYKRLEERLLKLIVEEKNPNLTFDEALNLLMDQLDAADKGQAAYEAWEASR